MPDCSFLAAVRAATSVMLAALETTGRRLRSAAPRSMASMRVRSSLESATGSTSTRASGVARRLRRGPEVARRRGSVEDELENRYVFVWASQATGDWDRTLDEAVAMDPLFREGGLLSSHLVHFTWERASRTLVLVERGRAPEAAESWSGSRGRWPPVSRPPLPASASRPRPLAWHWETRTGRWTS